MYDNPKDRKGNRVRANLDYYDKQAFVELAGKLHMQPDTLARKVIKDFIRQAREQQSSRPTEKQA